MVSCFLTTLQIPNDDDDDEGSLATLARQRQAALAAREEMQRAVAGEEYKQHASLIGHTTVE